MNLIDKILLRLGSSYLKRKYKELKKMSTSEQKPWWQSKGVIGSIVTIVIGVLGSVGINGLEAEKETITQLAVSLVTVAAGILSLYGRLKARKTLTIGNRPYPTH